MANRNWASSGKIYAMHSLPVLIDCNFVVDSTNGNGLGIRSLKGPLVQNVFMHTTVTPGQGNSNLATPGIPVFNPNPQDGTLVVQLQDNYFRSLSGFKAIVSPASGIALKVDNSALVVGIPYIISTLGDFTAAQWQAIGVPKGVTPAVGVSFIAKTVGAGANTSTSRVMTSAALGSNVLTLETVGDPNLSLSPDLSQNQGFGSQFILQFRDYAGNPAAPVDGTVVSLAFLLNNSSVILQGE